MSVTTDLVFVTPTRDAAQRFADIFETGQHSTFAGHGTRSWRPEEMKANGSYVSGSHVFHLGVNHLDMDVVDKVTAEPWPDGTVLYVWHEFYQTPTVTLWHGGAHTHEGEPDRW